MSDAPPPILPAGLAPGASPPSDERAPDGVLYFRIYATLLSILAGFIALAGGGMFVAPIVLDPGAVERAGAQATFYLAGIIYGAVGLVFLLPALIALFGGRKPWVHTLGTVVIALGMIWFCCLPLLVPLLIVWMKGETKRWYGA